MLFFIIAGSGNLDPGTELDKLQIFFWLRGHVEAGTNRY